MYDIGLNVAIAADAILQVFRSFYLFLDDVEILAGISLLDLSVAVFVLFMVSWLVFGFNSGKGDD